MKNFCLVISLLIFPLLLSAQERSINKFYNKYKNYDDVTSVKIQGWMLKIAANIVEDEEEEASEIMKKISHLRVLTMEDGNLVKGSDYKSFVNDIRAESFEELIMIRDEGTNINFFVKEKKEAITNVLVLISGDDEFIMLSLEGNLKYEDLSNLNIDIDGGEHFEKLPKKRTEKPRA